MVYNAISDISGNVAQFTDYVDVVLNHAGILSAYQKKLTIPYDAAMQTNFNDIRFNIWNGSAWEYVPYWIESKTDSSTADVWIKNDYNSGNTAVRMYYGNDGLSSESSGSDTFHQYHGAATAQYIDSLVAQPTHYTYESKIKRTSGAENFLVIGLANDQLNSDDSLNIQTNANTNNINGIARNEGVSSKISETPSFTINTYYNLKITYDGTTAHYYVGENEILSGTTTNFPDESMGLFVRVVNGTFEQEYSFIREYTAIEPTYSIGTPQHQRRHPQYQN